MWDLIRLAQVPGTEMSPGLSQDFMDGVYKPLRLFPIVLEYGVVVMSERLNPMGCQFSIPII